MATQSRIYGALGTALLCVILGAGACSRGLEQQPQPEGAMDYRQTLERARQRAAYETSLTEVKTAVQTFQVQLGRLPTNLFELVRFNYIDELPEAVPPGYTFGYDATRGHVMFVEIPVGDLPDN